MSQPHATNSNRDGISKSINSAPICKLFIVFSRSQLLAGNAYREALPPRQRYHTQSGNQRKVLNVTDEA
ncbi:MAG: hypothetical protein DSM106950_20915 [Stigonema ocellatum SAG 48.90 = DSM 106950]|nr:hypothetical protein [Stigonema ocellatum SAG 48.90 = DSM 106950]